MGLLLDECVPRPLGKSLTGHDLSHVTALGWSGVRNGRLLEEMLATGFQGLVTVDRNLADQQDVANSGVFVVQLVARSNRLDSLLALVPDTRS